MVDGKWESYVPRPLIIMVWQDYVNQASELLNRDTLRQGEAFVERQNAKLKFTDDLDELWSAGVLYGASQILLWINEGKDGSRKVSETEIEDY